MGSAHRRDARERLKISEDPSRVGKIRSVVARAYKWNSKKVRNSQKKKAQDDSND